MMNPRYVMDLNEIDPEIEMIGGKALNLSKMSDAGFNVPQAFIVTVDAYNIFIKNILEERISEILESINFTDEGSIIKGCSAIRSMIKGQKLSQDLFLEIKNRVNQLDDGLYAVRSSAVAEDLADASFAGQLDSFLNVGREDILEKVISCWASYWNDRAVKYRHDASMDHLGSGIAVLVQRMVDADVSGVIFTANPVDGSEDVVIESTWGLGEAIASGMVTPDIYVLNRNGDIIQKNIKTKNKAHFPGKKSLTSVDEEYRAISSLDDKNLTALLERAVQLEEFFEGPQDIEWALENDEIYVLQSRPVTTLHDKDDILWTRAYGDEYWADATTPLFYDVMGKMLTDYVNHEGARIMGYKEITDTELLKLHKSRVYFNTWVLEKAFSYYPKFARSKELLNYFPLDDQERISRYPSILHKTLLSQLYIAIRDPDGMMHKTDKAYQKWSQGFMKKCEDFDKTDLKVLSNQELLSLYREIENAGIKHYRLIRYGMVSHSIATNLMVKNWLVEWLDDKDGALYAALISGLDDNKTVEMNIRFSDLAGILRRDENLKDMVERADSNSLDEFLALNPEFKENFDLFISDYGHRSNTREILYPRWREDRAYVLEVVKSLSSSNLDLREKERESRENRYKKENEVSRRIKKLRAGFIKEKIFNIVLNLAQRYLTFRENQRFYLDHLLFRQRLMILDMGRRLILDEIIRESDDVFFLTEEELMGFMRDEKAAVDLKDKISARKGEFYRYKSLLPPKFLKNGIEFDDTVMEYDKNAVYGAAASPGTFKGIARVVESIAELSSLKEDEILITSNTDPAWTAVFSKVGGLITETGGILSHGAVISREYRIPAVTAVKGATKIFKTGEELMVDGNEGVIYKKES